MTDRDTVDVAKMVLVGKVNKDIVLRINRHGQPAVGISGDDGGLFRVSTDGAGRQRHRLRRQGRPRRHRTCSTTSRDDYISVIASVGADRDGQTPTTSTPTRPPAQSPTRSARARSIFLTDVAGWLRDPDDPDSLITRGHADEVEHALDDDRAAA